MYLKPVFRNRNSIWSVGFILILYAEVGLPMAYYYGEEKNKQKNQKLSHIG